jgi:hypothetical protein
MDQPAASLRARPETWRRLDTAVRPASSEGIDRSSTRRIGEAIGNLGGRLRSEAVIEKVGAADAVGRVLQRAGAYLDQRDVQDLRVDAERLIVRRPLVSIALALCVGYVAGRAIWR